MPVKARMRCHAITPRSYLKDGQDFVYGKDVRLSPVYSSDPADPNFSYSQATPNGEVYLAINNPAAYDQFVEGKVYDITFEEHVEPIVEPTAA